MRFYEMSGWDDRQHYHDGRRPSWIKFYVDLLNPSKHPKYHALSDGAKLTLHHLWLVAADCDNRIPETWLNRDRLNMQTRPKIDELLEVGYIVSRNGHGSSDISSGDSSADSRDISSDTTSPHVSESESKSLSGFDSEKLNSWQESAFAEIWCLYPRRVGRKGALRHFKASVTDESGFIQIKIALQVYLASGEVARGFLMKGPTWFNQWQDWTTDPEAKAGIEAPDRNARRDAIVQAARDMKASTDPIVQAYLAWLCPVVDARSDRIMREDALTFDEWMEKRKGG